MNRHRFLIASDIHWCHIDWYGVPTEERMARFVRHVKEEFEKEPFEALLLLGDYSLDHWKWNIRGCWLTEGKSYTRTFAERCVAELAALGVPVAMIAGNHEQYGEALWTELTGYHRRDHLVCGDLLFILPDTFGADLDPTEHSDGTFCPAQMDFIREMMARYPDKKVVLCAHWFDMEKENEDFRSLLSQEDRILCLFCGHNHLSRIASTGEACGNKPIICTGHYSYSGEGNPIRCMNGYREVLITEEGIASKYIVPPHTYTMGNVKFTTEYAEQDDITLLF